MRTHRLLGSLALTAALAGVPAGDAWGQKDKKKDDAKPTESVDSEKVKAGEFVGVLKTTPGTDRMFTVEVEQVKLVPSGKGAGGKSVNSQAQKVLHEQTALQQAEAQLSRAKTPQQRSQAMSKIRQHNHALQAAVARLQGSGGGPPPGYKYEKSKVAVEFQAAEKAKVRTMLLPETFDEKGNVKKYTAKEIADLKGKDASLPGYESGLEKLEVGQKVKVVTAAVAKKPSEETSKGDDEKMMAEKSKQAKLLVVLEKAADPPPAKGPPKKK